MKIKSRRQQSFNYFFIISNKKEKPIFSVCQKWKGEERELSYVYHSGVCRALFKTHNGSESGKRSSQIFYYYFSTPIFYVGLLFLSCLKTKTLDAFYLHNSSVVYRRKEMKKISFYVWKRLRHCVYGSAEAEVNTAEVTTRWRTMQLCSLV